MIQGGWRINLSLGKGKEKWARRLQVMMDRVEVGGKTPDVAKVNVIPGFTNTFITLIFSSAME
jgi:hypothetical protein